MICKRGLLLSAIGVDLPSHLHNKPGEVLFPNNFVAGQYLLLLPWFSQLFLFVMEPY